LEENQRESLGLKQLRENQRESLSLNQLRENLRESLSLSLKQLRESLSRRESQRERVLESQKVVQNLHEDARNLI